MKFNEKLIKLRKERGMTQEALAFELGVSRQSVSKWEQGDFEPDIAKLKDLCKIFSVSLDSLVNDEDNPATECAYRRVTLKESEDFLARVQKNAFWIAFATLLCILSPICLLLLGAMSEVPKYRISEDFAGGLGLIVLFIIIAPAVVIFILCGERTASFSFLEKEKFETERGVKDMIEEKRKTYRAAYLTQNVVGCSLCIISPIPLFIGIIINPENDLFIVSMPCATFCIAAVGAFLFIRGSVVWGGFDKLQQTVAYTPSKKK